MLSHSFFSPPQNKNFQVYAVWKMNKKWSVLQLLKCLRLMCVSQCGKKPKIHKWVKWCKLQNVYYFKKPTASITLPPFSSQLCGTFYWEHVHLETCGSAQMLAWGDAHWAVIAGCPGEWAEGEAGHGFVGGAGWGCLLFILYTSTFLTFFS